MSEQAELRRRAEAEILRACQQGRHELATTRTLETYGPELMGFLVARLRDHELASEAFSEFALDLWRGIDTFEGRSSVRVWAYALLRHAMGRVLDRQRRHQRGHVPLSEVEHISRLVQAIRTETMSFLGTARRDGVAELREQLPPDDQNLLILRINEGLDWKDVALIMTYDGRVPADDELRREAARLRKRFQLVKDRLRDLARDAGLLDDDQA